MSNNESKDRPSTFSHDEAFHSFPKGGANSGIKIDRSHGPVTGDLSLTGQHPLGKDQDQRVTNVHPLATKISEKRKLTTVELGDLYKETATDAKRARRDFLEAGVDFEADLSESDTTTSASSLAKFEEEFKANEKRKLNERVVAEANSIATKTWLDTYSRWLFSNERRNLSKLSEKDQHEQRAIAAMQQYLRDCEPGQYLFLCLMTIPLELRECIYAAMFRELPSAIILRTWDLEEKPDCLQGILPPICYVNRRVFQESVPVFLRGKSITVGKSGAYTLAQLARRAQNNAALKGITGLIIEKSIHWNSRQERLGSDGQTLVKACTGLRDLVLAIDGKDIMISETDETSRPMEELRTIFDLQAVFDLPKLTHFTLICAAPLGIARRKRRMNDDKGACTRLFAPLVEWIQAIFAQEKPHIRLDIEYDFAVRNKGGYVGFGPEPEDPKLVRFGQRLPRWRFV